MKLSAYYRAQGKRVILKTDLENLHYYEKVYISKVFSNTRINLENLNLQNVVIGGTGFFYDTKPKLSYDIEHIKPDYSLYDDYVMEQFRNGAKATSLKHYTDYSIGFLTRGCFRKCSFCVNRTSNGCIPHSPLTEFYDPNRKKIMLLDDNILANPDWQDFFYQLMETGKPFTFKQGIDIRLVSADFAKIIDKAKYDRDIYFSFDNIADREIIERKLHLLREHTKKPIRMYVLCGYDYSNKYDNDFWLSDIQSIFLRLEVIGRYGVTPFLMRHNNYLNSPYAGLYKNLASFCNKGGIFKKSSFENYCISQEEKSKKGNCSVIRYYKAFLNDNPEYEVYCKKEYWHRL